MFNANENKEKARALIEKYLCNISNQNLVLCKEKFDILMHIALDPRKGKIQASQFLRELFPCAASNWNPCECEYNRFESFVKDQNSKPTQESRYMVGLKQAKDIVDWLDAQEGWLF